MTSQILNISKHLLNAKRVLVIDGAGISVDAGIPDFRSEMGLYELVKSKYPGVVTTGKDLFDAALFRNPTQTALFYSFIAALKVLSDNASITKTHLFIKMLADTQKLLRCYTQNIDDLHERCGLIPGMDKTAQVVQMHGNLTTVKCTLCSLVKEFDSSTLSLFDDGKAPPCPDCMDKSQIRLAMGKRAINVGTLRPNIVLYNEHHAQGDSIAQLQNFDLKKRPDLLFVMGTSLKIPGVKNLIKSISELMKSTTTKSRPIIVYVNMTRAGREWEEIFDYQLLGPSDQTCTLLWDKLNDLTAEAESRRAKRLLRKQKEEKIEAKITDYFPVKKDISSGKPTDDLPNQSNGPDQTSKSDRNSKMENDTDKKNSTLGNKKLVKSKDVKSKNDSKQNIRISKKNSNLDIEEAMSLTGKENSKKPELISSKTSQDTPSPNLISPAATDLNDIFPEEDKQTVEDHTFFRTYQAKSKKETIQKSVNTQKTTSKPAAKTETQFLDITNHSSKSTRSKLAESPTKKHKTTLIDRELVQPISFRI